MYSRLFAMRCNLLGEAENRTFGEIPGPSINKDVTLGHFFLILEVNKQYNSKKPHRLLDHLNPDA